MLSDTALFPSASLPDRQELIPLYHYLALTRLFPTEEGESYFIRSFSVSGGGLVTEKLV